MPCLHCRKAGHRRPASAAVHSSAASASTEEIVCRPTSLPVSHWFRHQHHHHATAHPYLRQDLMSTMHLSRPNTAQPWVSASKQRNHAVACSSTSRHTDKHVQCESLTSSCVSPRQPQARHVDSLAPSRHNDAEECSTARHASVYPAPCNAECEAEAAVEQSNRAAVDDQSSSQEAHLQHVGTACLPESSSSAFSTDRSRRLSSRESTTCREGSSLQQADSRRQLGAQAGGHRRVRAGQQEWPPQGARWRSAALYKLQAPPMHLPTAKVCSCCHSLR